MKSLAFLSTAKLMNAGKKLALLKTTLLSAAGKTTSGARHLRQDLADLAPKCSLTLAMAKNTSPAGTSTQQDTLKFGTQEFSCSLAKTQTETSASLLLTALTPEQALNVWQWSLAATALFMKLICLHLSEKKLLLSLIQKMLFLKEKF